MPEDMYYVRRWRKSGMKMDAQGPFTQEHASNFKELAALLNPEYDYRIEPAKNAPGCIEGNKT